MPRFDVVGCGALNWDSVLRVENINAGGGRDTEWIVEDEAEAPGGSAANTIYGLAKLGLECAFVGAVGRDRSGREILKDFQSVGVHTSFVLKKQGATGEALCLTDRSGRRAISIRPRANSLLTSRNISTAISALRDDPPTFLHLSSFAGDQIALQVKLANALKGRSAIACAPGTLYVKRGRTRLTELLTYCTHLFFNRHEITQLMKFPEPEYEGAAAALMMHLPSCREIIVTLGSGHSKNERPDAVHQLPLVPSEAAGTEPRSAFVQVRGGAPHYVEKSRRVVPIMDGTGAGDAFTAGYLYGLARGWPTMECAHAGQAVAERSLQALGARAGLPAKGELLHDLEEEAIKVPSPSSG